MDLQLRKIHKHTIYLCIAIFSFTCNISYSNNVEVKNVSFTEVTGDNYITISFDLSWENSWRIDSAPSEQRDAIWLFMKYSNDGGESWHTVHLKTGSYTSSYSLIFEDGLINPSLPLDDVTNPCIGVFFYRSTNAIGTGDMSKTGRKIRWEYKKQGLDDGDLVKIKVFAIEMVYVQESPFYIGSGPLLSEYGCFYTYNTTDLYSREPYQITSENAITVGKSNGNLYYKDGITVENPYTRIGDKAGPIPDAYPKGYRSFYCMKYELSQGQYADFLNTLTPRQDLVRYFDPSDLKDIHKYRYTLELGSQGNRSASTPDRACNFLAWEDCCAYLDWAGLRPMTELEFEKACRGPEIPVEMECAWGDSSLFTGTTISNDGINTEKPDAGNCNFSETLPKGTFRVGSYASATSTRATSGASFYGIMDLSGNLRERIVATGNSTGRDFTGSHGDGELTLSGHATNTDWPGYNLDSLKVACYKTGGSEAKGHGFRGGSFTQNRNSTRVSFRDFAAYNSDKRSLDLGIRGVRTVIE